MRIAIAAAVTCLSIMGVTATAQVHAAIRQHTEIPPEPLDLALRTLAKDRGFQLVYLTENVATLQTSGAIGDFTIDEALKKLLSDSRLEYKFVDDNTVSIFPKTSPTSSLGKDRARAGGSDQSFDGSASKSSHGEQFRLAQVGQGAPAGAVSVDNGSAVDKEKSKDASGLSEIVVTAQKKSERLQDVPIPVSVLNADTLTDNGQVLLRDYFSSVPGLNFSPNFGNSTTLTIRGIAADAFGNPTVAVLIDDLPFTTATNNNNGTNVPDLDPGDLEHVEVLRGPQGTLYGANGMGGVIKYVTKDPSTDGFSGRVETGTNDVSHGAEPGYNVRGSVNIPLNDTMAVRMSAFTRQDAGYIYNVGTHADGVNEAQTVGARMSALWRPTQDFSLKLTALDQNTRSNGLSEVNQPTAGYPQTAGLGDLQQNYIPNTGESDSALRAFSATIKANLGGFDITSLTGYTAARAHVAFDFSSVFGPGTVFAQQTYDTKVNQELRLLVPLGQKFEWLVGGYFTNESSQFDENIFSQDPSGNFLSEDVQLSIPAIYKEFAAFTDLTYHVTERFDVQLGGRESRTTASTMTQQTKENAFTYLLTPQLKLTPDMMLYVRLASGYRPGTPNPPPACGEPGIPCQYSPDKTQNYDLGFKGDFLNHLVSVDASVYYVKWKDIQVQLSAPNTGDSYLANGGNAKSQGVELSATVRPMTVTGWVSYDDAVLTSSFPANSQVVGVAGDRLPFSSRISGNFSLNQEFPLGNTATGFAGGALSYVGDRENVFVPAGADRITLPAYAKIDLHAGAKYDFWTANLYANNVANRRGVLNNSLANGFFPFAYVVIPPRTIGLNVSRTF